MVGLVLVRGWFRSCFFLVFYVVAVASFMHSCISFGLFDVFGFATSNLRIALVLPHVALT